MTSKTTNHEDGRESRISAQRKREICMAAKQVFLEKGYNHTTMEDVIAAVAMSKGGVYYYYKSTSEILRDLCMKYGMENQYKTSQKIIEDCAGLSPEDLAVELTVYKIFGGDDYKRVFRMFCEASTSDPDLAKLLSEIEEESYPAFLQYCDDFNFPQLKCFGTEDFMRFIHLMCVGLNHFPYGDYFMHESDFFRDFFRFYIRKQLGQEEEPQP
ncbi:MAG: TetR/AcrR family transcriptional regulator [Eubacteriales bacterium]|nr:TetR/AcrR family transcriptional regulator [Eubacteriales bacterium]